MSWVGIALILVACVFVTVDLVATNHGLPTVAAAVAFILGALTLFGVTAAYSGAMLAVLLALALLVGGVLVAGSSEALAARDRPAMTGVEGMIGEVGDVVETVGAEPLGWVFVHGELWRAVPAVAPEDAYEQEGQERIIEAGEKVQVVGLRDGKVVVMPVEATRFEHPSEG